MTLKGRRAVLRREKTPDRIGMIWIPETAQKRPLEGTVVMVGDRCHTLQEGQRVLFPARNWSPFPTLGEDHVLVLEEHVLCVLEEDR